MSEREDVETGTACVSCFHPAHPDEVCQNTAVMDACGCFSPVRRVEVDLIGLAEALLHALTPEGPLARAERFLASPWLAAHVEAVRVSERVRLTGEVEAAFDPGELDCARLGLPCASVNPADRWCRACRIRAALVPVPGVRLTEEA